MGIVSKVLGHSSIKMTERIYAKWLPKTIVNEVNKVAIKEEAKDKFNKLVALSVDAVTTGNGSYAALEDAFNDYFEWYENEVQRENLATFGGAPGSLQNRNVLAGQISRAIRFGACGIDDNQLGEIKQVLNEIVNNSK